MAAIRPFQGIRYNPERVRDLSRVISPPYDVINGEDQNAFYRASPYNVIRLELGKARLGDDGVRNRYTRARDFFEKWFSGGVLFKDKEPSLYIYEQSFRKGNRIARRLGFVALLKLGSAGTRAVYPHERTFPSPKADRSLLLKALQTNTSPLFFLFADREDRVARALRRWIRNAPPVADVPFQSERHRLWRMTDPALIAGVCRRMRRSPLFIADGHHRYEVACAFRQKRKRDGAYVLAYFSNLLDADLTILPIHRLVRHLGGTFETFQKKLAKTFSFRTYPTARSLFRAMERAGRSHVFGVSWKGHPFTLLRLKDPRALSVIDRKHRRSQSWRRLDVTILHELILKHLYGFSQRALREEVRYTRDVRESLREVRKGRYQVAFFLNPPRMEAIRRIALAGERVPQKSTYFYPKPMAGLVMYRFGKDRP